MITMHNLLGMRKGMNMCLSHQFRQLTTPILASVMCSRPAALAITGAAAAQSILLAAGLPGWPCPFRHVLGIPCPGCGLSRALVALLHGDWHTTLATHAFAPILLAALLLIGCAALLPAQPRQALIAYTAAIERRTGLTALLLIGLVFYWAARLALDPAAFIQRLAT